MAIKGITLIIYKLLSFLDAWLIKYQHQSTCFLENSWFTFTYSIRIPFLPYIINVPSKQNFQLEWFTIISSPVVLHFLYWFLFSIVGHPWLTCCIVFYIMFCPSFLLFLKFHDLGLLKIAFPLDDSRWLPWSSAQLPFKTQGPMQPKAFWDVAVWECDPRSVSFRTHWMLRWGLISWLPWTLYYSELP